MRKPRNLLPLSIALLALAIATTGTAAAATGQLVNIADGTNAGALARVDGTGALKVAAVPMAPARPYNTNRVAPNDNFGAVTTPTLAQIALNRVQVAGDSLNNTPSTVFLYYGTVPSGAECYSGMTDFRLIGEYGITPASSFLDAFPTPLVLKPNGTRPWCLIAANYKNTSSGFSSVRLTMSGFVVSGTPPAGTAADGPASPERPVTRN